MANAEAKYKIACDAYERAAKAKDDATLALSQAKRNLDAADRAFEAAKDAKEEAFKVLEACSSVKREVVSMILMNFWLCLLWPNQLKRRSNLK